MYNQRESLAYIVITPALQAGGPRFEPASAHHQIAENTYCVFNRNPRPPQAGDHSACQYLGNLPKKCHGDLCSDCPPVGYPTDRTRCDECPWHGGGAA